uniref:hypothetical protein n=1 Tax=Bacillus canaveralius TaxID=1403243 RepID=UPI0015E0FB61|nr:hypothetical protein [Bacillus canaveralius]
MDKGVNLSGKRTGRVREYYPSLSFFTFGKRSRETALGGLAMTETGKRVKESLLSKQS